MEEEDDDEPRSTSFISSDDGLIPGEPGGHWGRVRMEMQGLLRAIHALTPKLRVQVEMLGLLGAIHALKPKPEEVRKGVELRTLALLRAASGVPRWHVP